MMSMSFFSFWTMFLIARKRTVKGENSTVRFGSEAAVRNQPRESPDEPL
jgi:hypothetical protein